jgi:hypothetical protein
MSYILAPNKEMLTPLLTSCLRAHRFCLRAYLVLRGAYAGLRAPQFCLRHTAPLQGVPCLTWTQGFRTWLYCNQQIQDDSIMFHLELLAWVTICDNETPLGGSSRTSATPCLWHVVANWTTKAPYIIMNGTPCTLDRRHICARDILFGLPTAWHVEHAMHLANWPSSQQTWPAGRICDNSRI